MRKPIIAGNHKMNLTPLQTRNLLTELVKNLIDYDQVEIIVSPPFTSLAMADEVLRATDIQLAAQNVHQAAQGAYTGEVSAKMLKASGCQWVICGHSERRNLFQESNELVNKKIRAVTAMGLKPILCVGETLAERELGQTNQVLARQISGSLQGFQQSDLLELVVAYEPVWAIGTGKTAASADAEAGCQFIRSHLKTQFGPKLADSIRILYGGSVKPGNIKELMAEKNIDGALVGGASLKSADFLAIVKYHE